MSRAGSVTFGGIRPSSSSSLSSFFPPILSEADKRLDNKVKVMMDRHPEEYAQFVSRMDDRYQEHRSGIHALMISSNNGAKNRVSYPMMKLSLIHI